MRIRTLLGGAAAGIALTAAFAAPAIATDTAAEGATCATVGEKATVGNVNLTCSSAKTWVKVDVQVTKTEATTNATQGQTAGTDQKARGDGNTQQSCTQQAQVVNGAAGAQVCINVNGNLILVAAPSGCSGATCGQIPAEIPAAAAKATCTAAGQKIETTINGVKMIGTCKAAGAATIPVTKAAVESESLPVTGSNTTIMVAVGILVLGVGTAMFLVARRRRVRFQV